MAKTYHQGKYIPINPEKYIGNPNEIFYRSSWEKKLMLFFDKTPAILEWNSEETVIPYISPLASRAHRYFTDFSVVYKTKTGEIKKAIVEVKPFKQTLPPENKSRKTKQFINEVSTYAVNQAKWAAARDWCKKKGFEFMLITEKELGIGK